MIRILLILVMFALPLACQDLPAVDDVLEQFEQAGKSLTSFQADVLFEELDEFGDSYAKQGKIYFLAPGRYLMVTELDGKPQEEVGKNQEVAWRTRHHVKTVDRVDVAEEQEVSDGYTFADADDLRRSFDLAVVGVDELAEGKAWHLVGTPREESKLQKFEVWISVENPSPVLKLRASKQRIQETLTFSNIRRNIEIDPDLFEYQVPSGYTEHVR